jgi:diadenosine tetraphosphate (Ap4A) HIT family hydrolase
MSDRFLTHLPIGAPPAPIDAGIPGWEIFPFEGDLRVKTLAEPVLPEPPRNGEDGPENCFICRDPSAQVIWSDERWLLRHPGEPSAVPVVVLLCPRAHHDFLDLPPDLTADLVPLLQRVERAIMSLGGVARVHIEKIGDGASHLHMWFISRPEGLTQLRGSCLVMWDDVLPKQPRDQWETVLRELAATLAADGGTAGFTP